MPFRMGPWEIGLILTIILLVFGVGKLPQVGGVIGKGLRAFQRGRDPEDDGEEKPAPKDHNAVFKSYAKQNTNNS